MGSSNSIGEPDHSYILDSSDKLKLGTDSPSIQIFSVPPEISLHIVSFLNAFDVFSLGCCSKPLNVICNSDTTWKDLYMKRWPDHYSQILCTKPKGKEISTPWKARYISRHKEIYNAVHTCLMPTFEQLQESNFLEVEIYNEAIEALRDLQLGFEDVCLFFLKRKIHVVLNLIGVHYSFLFLQVSGAELRNVISGYQVSDRELTVYWVLNPPYPLECTSERCYLVLSLGEITSGEEAILYLLQNGPSMNIQYIAIADYFELPKNNQTTLSFQYHSNWRGEEYFTS